MLNPVAVNKAAAAVNKAVAAVNKAVAAVNKAVAGEVIRIAFGISRPTMATLEARSNTGQIL